MDLAKEFLSYRGIWNHDKDSYIIESEIENGTKLLVEYLGDFDGFYIFKLNAQGDVIDFLWVDPENIDYRQVSDTIYNAIH
jgi:hypothetical protein